MILEDKFQEEILSFCLDKGIDIKNGRILSRYMPDIKQYIKERLDAERLVTKRQEEEISMSMNYQVKLFLNNIWGEILFSPIEEFLHEALKRNKLDHLTQREYAIGPYKIDFAIPVVKLAIECDGAEYHRENQEQLDRDQRRDKYLARKGWRTLRIEGIAIRKDINYCIERIKQAIGTEILNPPDPEQRAKVAALVHETTLKMKEVK